MTGGSYSGKLWQGLIGDDDDNLDDYDDFDFDDGMSY